MDIVNGKKLGASAYLEGNSDDKQFTVEPGRIVDPHKEAKGLAIINRGDEDITLYSGTSILHMKQLMRAMK